MSKDTLLRHWIERLQSSTSVLSCETLFSMRLISVVAWMNDV